MNSIRNCLLLVGICAMLGSCSTTETVTCITGRLSLRYVGFSRADLSTTLLYRYPAGTNFSGPADTLTLQAIDDSFAGQGDTLVSTNRTYSYQLSAGYDYVLRVPQTGDEFRISEIKLEGQETMTFKQPVTSKLQRMCINAVTSYRIDGNLFIVENPEYDENYATLVR